MRDAGELFLVFGLVAMVTVLSVSFAVGIWYVDTHAGFDIVTNGGFTRTVEAFIKSDGSNYTVFQNGQSASFHTNLAVLGPGCYRLTFSESAYTRSVSATLVPVQERYCK